MNRRLAVYELTATFALEKDKAQALAAVAGLDEEPNEVSSVLARSTAVIGAALVGLGIILWLAANWPDFSRATKFGLLQGMLVISLVGAWLMSSVRTALLLLALLAQGGLLAFFGQTYQTGADAWQLFFLWAAIGLPLALASRHDALWLPWSLVAMMAISFWTEAHAGRGWAFHGEVSLIYTLSWLMDAALLLLLSRVPAVSRLTGAGPWSFRTAALLVTSHLSAIALGALFASPVALHYPAGLLVMFGGAWLFSRQRYFDVFVLSVVVLAIDVLLIAGLCRFLFDSLHPDGVFSFLILGLLSAGIVAASAGMVREFVRAQETGAGEGRQ